MRARIPILGTPDMQQTLLQIDLIPSQGHQFRYPERMPEGDQDQGTITMPVTTHLTSSPHQALNLFLRRLSSAGEINA
jgi:hypothetical protein